MVLRDLGDAGERRFEDQRRATAMLRRQVHRDPRTEQLAVEHEPVRRRCPRRARKSSAAARIGDRARLRSACPGLPP